MTVNDVITRDFQSVNAYDAVKKIANRLVGEKYMVVLENDEFQGIITPEDLVRRPYRVVIDCMSPVASRIEVSDSIQSVFEKFHRLKTPALPVFAKHEFVGVIDYLKLVQQLKNVILRLHHKAQIAETVKRNFLKNLSHEIRTPLNGILGFMDIISQLDEQELAKNGYEYYNIVKNCADRFLLIMEGLIDLSKIAAGEELLIECEPVSMPDLLAKLKYYFETTNELTRNQQVEISIEHPESPLKIHSDANKIRTILYHLLDNAIKHSDNQLVHLHYFVNAAGEVEFRVSNTAQNLPEENQVDLFNFYEKFHSDETQIKGIGLGLPLTRELARMLNGALCYQSENKHAIFTLKLPGGKPKSNIE